MPGLTGILYPDFLQTNQRILPMLEILQHRGQDQQIHNFKNLEIGVCGTKFITNPKKTIWIGIDGTLSKLFLLQQELKKEGFHPLSENYELLLYAYQLWGAEFLKKLSGEFALFLFDQEKQKLILARDSIGHKPLYWFHHQNHFLFASEMKALLRTGIVPQTPALEALSSYLYFGYIPQDMSPIDKVNKLLPSHYLELHLNGRKNIQQYWSYSSYFRNTSQENRSTITQKLDHLLDESIKQKIDSNEKVGCFLSGELGSAAMAHYLKKNIPQSQNLLALTTQFKGDQYNINNTQQIIDTFHLPYKNFLIDADHFLSDIVKIIWCLDEPCCNPNIITTWNLSKLARKYVSSVFSNMAHDEFGYKCPLSQDTSTKWLRLFKTIPKHLWLYCLFLCGYFSKTYKFSYLKHTQTKHWQTMFLQKNIIFKEKTLYQASPRLAPLFTPIVFLHKFHRLETISSITNSFLYFDVKTRIVDEYIQQTEKITSSFGLQWKAPFLDRSIIEFLATLPEPLQMTGEKTTSYLQPLLKNILSPSSFQISQNTQNGFMRKWLTKETFLPLYQTLSKGVLVEAGIINEEWLRNQLTHIHKNNFAFRYIWSIFMLELWYKLYIVSPIASTPPRLKVKELFET